jgi:hypothetical protein
MLPFLLSVVLALSAPNAELSAQKPQASKRPHIVEENYSPTDTYRIIRHNNEYKKLTVHGKERYRQMVQSTKEILQLPAQLDVSEAEGGFLLPSKIDGIVMDIPFNYYSNLESSAKYFHTLLYNGWEIQYYNATSLCVQIGLIDENGVTCRIIIYDNYLKVYCRLIH